MKREENFIAIDLGSSSTKMACVRAGRVEIVPNRFAEGVTESAGWLDQQGNIIVGRDAIHSGFIDSRNAPKYFVRDLGRNHEYKIPHSARRANPEGLAAELLRSLKSDAERNIEREIKDVIITVSHGASTTRCAATMRAARRAGFDDCILIQDTAATALAFGAEALSENKTVLSFDFGESSLKVATVRLIRGIPQMVSGACESFIGGNCIDRTIVRSVFFPAIRAIHPELEISELNPNTLELFESLRFEAEQAKIRLSTSDRTCGRVHIPCHDATGNQIEFDYELTCQQLEGLATPFIDRSMSVCDRIIAETNLSQNEVTCVIPVGGMMLMPAVRKKFRERFGYLMESDDLPFNPTVTTIRGAAIFGQSQHWSDNDEELLTLQRDNGVISPRTSGWYSSSKLLKSISLGVGNNRLIRLFDKDSSLPARKCFSLKVRTTIGHGGTFQFPLLEGDSSHADRCREVSLVGAALDRLPSNLQLFTDVEFNIEISESYEMQASAYFPPSDKELELEIATRSHDYLRLSVQIDQLSNRLLAISHSSDASTGTQTQTVPVSAALKEILALLPFTAEDTDAADMCGRRLNELQARIGELEDAADRPRSVAELKSKIAELQKELPKNPYFSSDVESTFRKIGQSADDAVSRNDIRQLEDCSKRIDSLIANVRKSNPLYWLACFDALQNDRGKFSNGEQADGYIELGLRAIARKDFEVLQKMVLNLNEMLPKSCGLPAEPQDDVAEAAPFEDAHVPRPQKLNTPTCSNTSRAEAPIPRIDKVHFSVASPPAVPPGQKIIIDVWAHLERQRAEVERRVLLAYPNTDSPPVVRPKGPFKIERGTKLFVRLKFPDLRVEPPEDVILWEGEIGNASFEVAIPSETAEGVKSGLVSVHWEGGLQIARVPLQILVATKVTPAAPTTQPIHHIRKAFASYASTDRDEVIGRIQGMQKIAPDLDVFLDVVKLRSGEDWEKKLWQVIPESDVFYLFWSAAAKASPWVEKEWRCALEKGEEFIDPVPLVSPEEVRPPHELSKKHFNDWILAFKRGKLKTK